jgi:hypothetical protein
MIYVSTALNGFGNGFAFAALPNLIIETVDQTVSGVATGVNTIMRMAGGSLGGQIVTAIIVGHTVVATGLPEKVGYTSAFYLEAAAVAAAGVAALAIPSRRLTPATADAMP